MAEAPGTLEGWFALHDFRRIDWPRLKSVAAMERAKVVDEAVAFLAEAEAVKDASEGGTALYRILGHKADLLILHLRPTVEALSVLETRFARTRLASETTRPYSYLSAVELSLYEASARGGTEDESALMQQPFVRKRLFPSIPV